MPLRRLSLGVSCLAVLVVCLLVPLAARPIAAPTQTRLLRQPTISHHLKVLHEVGLLDRERRGTWVFYKARPEAMTALGSLFGAGDPAGATT